MKKLNKVIAVAAMLGLWSGTGFAQGLIYLNVNGTAQVQGETTTSGVSNNITKTAPPTRVHFGNKEILSDLATAHGTNAYPAGSRLAVNPSTGEIVVADKTGAIVDTVPELSLSVSNVLTSGTTDSANNTENVVKTGIATLVINNLTVAGKSGGTATVNGSADGIFTTRTNIGKANKNGVQTETDSGSGNLSGAGSVDAGGGATPAVFTISISGSGHGPLVP